MGWDVHGVGCGVGWEKQKKLYSSSLSLAWLQVGLVTSWRQSLSTAGTCDPLCMCTSDQPGPITSQHASIYTLAVSELPGYLGSRRAAELLQVSVSNNHN